MSFIRCYAHIEEVKNKIVWKHYLKIVGGNIMQIHVVSAGESIWSIAQAYNVGYQNIIQSNQLTNIEHLVIGQALVIPTMERNFWNQPSHNLGNHSLRN